MSIADEILKITTYKRLKAIRDVMKQVWDEHEANTPNIPEFQRPIYDTFDFNLFKFIQKLEKEGRFYECADWAQSVLN